MTDRAAHRALEQVTRELREERPPPVDWDRLEAALERRLSGSRPQAARRFIAPLLAAAAVATALTGVWLLRSPRLPPQAVGPSPSVVADGDRGRDRDLTTAPVVARLYGETLADGGVLAAPAGGLQVVHANRASWTLSPGGRARLVEAGDRLTIALESGSLRAEVAPGGAPGSFAVEVGGTRIAVQGTVFRVERRAERVAVTVERGVVVVGPVGARDGPQGTRLAAPAGGEFTLQGLPAAAPEDEPSAGPVVSPPAARPRGTTLRAAPSATARPGELEAAAYGVTGAVQRCFARHTPAAADSHLTAEVSVALVVAPDGSLTSLVFTPPLAPAVGDCSQTAARQVRLPAPGIETRIERRLTLVR